MGRASALGRRFREEDWGKGGAKRRGKAHRLALSQISNLLVDRNKLSLPNPDLGTKGRLPVDDRSAPERKRADKPQEKKQQTRPPTTMRAAAAAEGPPENAGLFWAAQRDWFRFFKPSETEGNSALNSLWINQLINQ